MSARRARSKAGPSSTPPRKSASSGTSTTSSGANVNPGDSLAVLAGTKSLWCGLRAATNGLACSYLLLPGYGNNWNQLWQTKSCITVTGTLDVSFLLETDSEYSYDATFLEFTTDCIAPFRNWTTLDGGVGVWDGRHGPLSAGGSYAGTGSPVKVRIRFASDGGFSDEDGNFDSHSGPVVVDNLVVEGLPLEDFEGDAINATETQDWEADVVPGYGASYMDLFRGGTLVQEDACAKNLSCMWAAIRGSPYNYACGGFPSAGRGTQGQRRRPIHQRRNLVTRLSACWDRHRHQPAVHRVSRHDSRRTHFLRLGRSLDQREWMCGPWRSRGLRVLRIAEGLVRRIRFRSATLVNYANPLMQVRLGVIDQCGVWCGVWESGCHSHAPLAR